MSSLRRLRRLAAGAAVVVGLLAGLGALGAQPAPPARPGYLRYAEFTAEDTPQTIAAKQAYNEAVQRYNQALYDYHVTLERHDRLVETHNTAADPAARKKAREEAQPLRARLADLRRDVIARATAVDEAARRAAAAGVTITR